METYEESKARERTESLAVQKKLRQVAKTMGFESVTPKNGEEWGTDVRAKNKDGEEFWVRRGTYGSNKGKAHVFGIYPSGPSGSVSIYGIERPSINVSLERTVEAIAKDIERRFLPDYREYLGKVRERVKSDTDYRSLTESNFEKVMGRKRNDNEKNGSGAGWLGSEFDCSGEVQVNGDSVTMTLRSVTPDQAAAILAILKK